MADQSGTDFLVGAEGDRRKFLRETVGRLMEEMVRRTERRVVPQRMFRPPGAIEEVAFLAACTRCGDCFDVCPVGAIVRAPPEAGLAAGTPMIDPELQPCTVCPDMPCAKVCPTEALELPERLWEGYRLASLELVPERCIAFQEVDCDVCSRVCPVGEKALSVDDGGKPVIRAEGCVGCGVCVRACVTTPASLKLHFT
ncbi:MAG: 4Fe-4S dicluster domain-containing protein [Gemmatimonadales bacterium]|nr:4Fe-4S dicluster domain-containing protein [Gemmatimonadales bacterium]NIN49110.1 4Fe-4S dicluster domain-containing protein [Gemmatimonadales bacterium]NIP06574.1 4Fe-4S dicluster domain-containing protein [Gemmatimonadales bacterium]NIR00271.1 4Fe-4S dicluster domain-containing protein [Gemmatimonadales bacterium]NIS64604.1 4Fe-4S dicluster domain-containing protein [Gemmatimonadales bacterium]